MGGMTALRLSLDHQEMVEKLILTDTTLKSTYSFGRRLVFLISHIAMSIAYESFMKYYVSSVFRQDYPKAEIEKALDKVRKNPKYVVRSCFSTIQGFDILSELAYIQAPTLIIHSSQSLNPLK